MPNKELLRERQNKKQHITEDLAELNRMVELFAYSTSHDLKAPLSTLSGLIQLMRKEDGKEHQTIYLEMMQKIVLQQEFFLHNITDLLKNARTEIHPEEINLEQIVLESFQQFSYLSHVHQIDKTVSIQGRHPFYSDIVRVRVILNNLISNAIRFQRDDSDTHRIEVSANIHPDGVVLKVSDNGIGIQPEYQERVFDLFFRATEKYTGNGFGLYITKEMVNKLEGKILVDSSVNKGTTVSVLLPNQLNIN